VFSDPKALKRRCDGFIDDDYQHTGVDKGERNDPAAKAGTMITKQGPNCNIKMRIKSKFGCNKHGHQFEDKFCWIPVPSDPIGGAYANKHLMFSDELVKTLTAFLVITISFHVCFFLFLHTATKCGLEADGARPAEGYQESSNRKVQ
jgi:hypothetical protein